MHMRRRIHAGESCHMYVIRVHIYTYTYVYMCVCVCV
jgi:hypothetical protein